MNPLEPATKRSWRSAYSTAYGIKLRLASQDFQGVFASIEDLVVLQDRLLLAETEMAALAAIDIPV